jgi:ribulose-phosphate 3-epimerase
MIDVMDGKFVNNTSLDFDFKLPSGLEYEAHLMVNTPLDWLEENAGKVDVAIMHVEVLENTRAAIDYAKNKVPKVVLALNPETNLDTVLPFLGEIDGILIMTVNPGSFCIEFLPEPLEKIKKLREIDKTIPIEVDGCMNPQNIKLARERGANIFASGSYIFKSQDINKAIRELEDATLQ